ncbi:probable aquaporin NIP7-1 [Aristolochia californica]|uniref:probable aquaporin NIP7-1 n=1 Tax=Aristolochia californica TaxID=171875 RepID=UPI0035DA552D
MDLNNSRSSSCSTGEDREMGPNADLRDGHQSLLKNRKLWSISPAALDSMRVVGAEFLGTFFMMFPVCGIIASTKIAEGAVGLLEYACAGGFAILVVIFAVGPISGAHVNPSITVAYAAIGEFPWSKVPLYVSAQTAGSAVATYVGMMVYDMEADFANTRPLRGLKMAFFSELIATSLIMFLGASMSDNAEAIGQLAGFAIAAAIALAVLITGPISGGSLNPVRSLGPAIVSWRFESLWLYLTAPTIGALAGALLYRLLKLQPNQQSSTTAQTEATRSAVFGSVICETNLSTHGLTAN